ncbi:MAG TPA: tetratricopeptide repeat protein [Planktothrix sp.]|jgi:hypothetical protein
MTQELQDIATQQAAPYRLGALLVDAKVVSGKEMKETLQIVRATGLPIGRVLLMSGLLDEPQLKAVLLCQSLLKEKQIDTAQALSALQLVFEKNVPFDHALSQLGWENSSNNPVVRLGDLLIECGFISEEQLKSSLEQAQQTGLPFGRYLVLSGILNESLLTSALNVQVLLRDKKIEHAEAIACLSAARQRQVGVEVPLQERGFYDLPRRGTRLGELFVLSGLITEKDLIDAIETALKDQTLIGQVFLEWKLIKEEQLQAALYLQRLIASGKMRSTTASGVLSYMRETGVKISEAIAHVEESAALERSTVTLLDFLKMVFAVSMGDVEQAVDLVKLNSELMGDALLLSGVMDENAINSAKLCCLLIERGVMPIEQACIIFDLAKREKITIPDAIARMHWSTGTVDDKLSHSDQADTQERQWQMSEAAARQSLSTGAADTEQKLSLLMEQAKKLPEGDLRLPHTLELLADFKCQNKAYDEAKSLLKEAIQLRTQVVGKTDLSVGRTFNNLAKIYYLQTNYEDAQQFCQRFLLICQNALGAEHPDVACGLTNLGSIFHVQGKMLEAEAAYKESLRICEARLGREHPATLRNLRAYAALLREMDREYDAHQLDLRLIGEFTGSWKTISP